MPCSLPCGKAGGLQILRCQGIAVGHYGFTLDALTLKSSDFCNVGVNYESESEIIPGTKIDEGIKLKGEVLDFNPSGVGIIFKSVIKEQPQTIISGN